MASPLPAIRGLLDLIHFSDTVRPVIDPMKHLTNKNIRGAEAALARSECEQLHFVRAKEFYDPYPPQSYWASEGYSKERGLGTLFTQLENRLKVFTTLVTTQIILPLAREKLKIY